MIRGFTPFLVGGVPIGAPLIQAPLDGYSDSPYRRVTRILGSPLSITEFINGLDVVHNTPNLPKRIVYSEEERPLVFQLFDDDPERIIQSAMILEERCHPDLFDVNMGCSARKVANRGAGAGLLRHPEKIRAIVAGLTARVRTPITVKLRLGWDADSINYLDNAKIAEDNGAQMVTLHARTREQQYTGHADWNAIAALKQHLHIPVIGNGDVCTIADAQRMMDETGCDAVMVGRAAITNPWIFSGYDFDKIPFDLFKKTCLKHLDDICAFQGEEYGCVVFRKFAVRYLSRFQIERELVRELVTTNEPEVFRSRFDTLLEKGNYGTIQ